MNFLSDTNEIVFLGPGGSYTEMAKDLFTTRYELYNAHQTPMKTIKSVVNYISETPNSLGVLPLENSIEGTIRETVDCIIKSNVNILSEITVPVKHCLISRTTELYSVTGIIAHPKALEQCKNFIENNMAHHLNIIEVSSTEEAARQLQNYNMTYAAIGSEKTAEVYYLNIIRDNINDEEDNQTRFALIGNVQTPQTSNDYSIIAFATENKPGSLVEMLQILSKYNVNITHIDSRPSVNFDGYMVLAEFEGHSKEPHITEMINELKSHTKFYKLLGSFENVKCLQTLNK
ncbi:prephenate dehydratase [bacterium]|nr:prephenate dehydratase [bacterium]